MDTQPKSTNENGNESSDVVLVRRKQPLRKVTIYLPETTYKMLEKHQAEMPDVYQSLSEFCVALMAIGYDTVCVAAADQTGAEDVRNEIQDNVPQEEKGRIIGV